jgi:hypothetical protein
VVVNGLLQRCLAQVPHHAAGERNGSDSCLVMGSLYNYLATQVVPDPMLGWNRHGRYHHNGALRVYSISASHAHELVG